MSKRSSTTLTAAARVLDAHPAALRKAINRFQIVERVGRQRVIPNDVLALFRKTKTVCGYLYPHWVRTRDELLAAAAQIPASEAIDLAEERLCDVARHHRDDVGQRSRHRHRHGGADG
jgi:hypothetical protein